MENLKLYFFYGFLFLSFTTCDLEQVIPYELEYEGNKLVVWSFIQPDEPVEVNVFPTYPPIGLNSLEIIDDAIVELYENDSLIKVLQHTELGIYTSNYFPVIGKNYHLEVSAAGFEEKVISEKVTIPQKGEILEIDFVDSTSISNSNIEGRMKISFNLHSEKNLRLENDGGILFSTQTTSNSIHENCARKTNFIFHETCLVIRNQLILNTKYDIRRKPENITFTLSTVSDSYLNFYISLDATNIEQGFGFVSEPTNIYTNMNGGYGLLGAYNPFEYTFEL